MNNPTIKEMVLGELSLHGDMPKGVRAFVKEHLEENGYGGLMNPEVDAEENCCCGCRLEELFISHDCYDIDECQAAYLHSDGMLRLEKEGKASKGVGPHSPFGKFITDCAEFKVCPHCGKEAETKNLGGNWKAVCSACDASVGLYATEAEAIAAWNRRAMPECPEVVWDQEGYYASVFGLPIGEVSDDGWWTFANQEGQCKGNPVTQSFAQERAKLRVEAAWLEFWNKTHGVKP